MIAFPDKKYNVIYSDPPWSFTNKNTGGSMVSGAASKYTMTPLDVVCKLPVETICADSCILFMWWVGSQPKSALRVVEAWGFKLKTMTGLVWVKTTKHGRPDFGMGFWTRAGSESCLIATRGQPVRADAGVRSVFSATKREHSQKPAVVRDTIVRLCGDVPRIELFARERAEGWDSIGDCIDGIDIGAKFKEMITE